MAIKPLGDRVLIRLLQAEEKTKGGIVLPDTAKEKPQEGEVVAVGSGRLLDSGTIKPLEVKVGDRVLFGKYSGTEVAPRSGKIDDDLMILREDDILAVLK